MYLDRYQHLYDLERTRVPIPDGGPDMMRLQRNEKPNNWPKDLQDLIFGTIPEDLLQRYPDPTVAYQKLSTFLGIPEKNLLLTSGIEEAIRVILTLACEPGDTFAVPWPTYAMYKVNGDILNLKLAPITYTPEHFTTPAEIDAGLPQSTKVLFLPNPSQPVENCFDIDQLREIASNCQKKKIVFAVDEAYQFFGGPSAIPLIDEFQNVLVMRSFSKAFGSASLRFGYLIGSDHAIRPLDAYRLGYESNSLCLHAASVLLDCFDSHVQPSIDSICEGRDYIRTQAIEHGMQAWGSVSNSVLIDLGSNERMIKAGKSLESKNIYVKWALPAPLDRHILVTCGPREIMGRFLKELLDSLGDN